MVICFVLVEYSEKGEDLPLGPNFQQLLKLYYRYFICWYVVASFLIFSYSNEQPVRNEVEMFLKQLEWVSFSILKCNVDYKLCLSFLEYLHLRLNN